MVQLCKLKFAIMAFCIAYGQIAWTLPVTPGASISTDSSSISSLPSGNSTDNLSSTPVNDASTPQSRQLPGSPPLPSGIPQAPSGAPSGIPSAPSGAPSGIPQAPSGAPSGIPPAPSGAPSARSIPSGIPSPSDAPSGIPVSSDAPSDISSPSGAKSGIAGPGIPSGSNDSSSADSVSPGSGSTEALPEARDAELPASGPTALCGPTTVVTNLPTDVKAF